MRQIASYTTRWQIKRFIICTVADIATTQPTKEMQETCKVQTAARQK